MSATLKDYKILKLTQIEPNPFRNIQKYPLERQRIDKLKASVGMTNFWGGVLCRPHPTKKNKYQLAFGHHRLKALKELKWTEVDIKVLPLEDIQMLQSMAEENQDIGQHNIKVMVNTIEQVRLYLDSEIAKIDKWKQGGQPSTLTELFSSNTQFQQSKKRGVGRKIIKKFLGKSWKDREIRFALAVLDKEIEGTIDREALEEFDNRYQAEEFQHGVREEAVPVEKQKEYAKKAKAKVGSYGGRSVRRAVRDVAEEQRTGSKPKKTKEDPRVTKARNLTESIRKSCNRLMGETAELRDIMEELPIADARNIRTILAGMAIQDLMNHLANLLKKEQKNAKAKTLQLQGTTV